VTLNLGKLLSKTLKILPTSPELRDLAMYQNDEWKSKLSIDVDSLGKDLLRNMTTLLSLYPNLAYNETHILDDNYSKSCIWEETQYVKHNTTFVYFQPLTHHPVKDHAMEGPTYKLALAREAILFQQKRDEMLEIWELEEDDIDWFRIFRKMAANVTGMYHVVFVI
jgi:hypothetical protein